MCMYTYARIHMYVEVTELSTNKQHSLFSYVYVHICTYTYLEDMCVYIHMQICVYIYMFTYICVYARTYTYVCVHTYTYACT